MACFLPPRNLADARVLIIDDNPDLCDALVQLFTSWQMEIETRRSLENALDDMLAAADAKKPFGVVLADLDEARPRGSDFLSVLGSAVGVGCLPKPLIVLMTIAVGPVDMAALPGVSGVMTKPVTGSHLFDSLMEACAGHGLGIVGKNDAVERLSLFDRASVIRGARILLVEDNAINQEVACSLLQKMGLRVKLANNGEETVEMAKEQSFDAILMDLQMPVMDGFAATKAIRAADWGKDVPIIAMTAAVFESDRSEAIRTGMNDHLGKPIDARVLLDCLIRWIAPSRQTEPEEEKTAAAEPARAALLPTEMGGFDVMSARERLSGDDDLLLKLMHRFLADYEAWGQRFHEVAASGDGETAQRMAHTLKGAAGIIGAQRLQRSAVALEASLRQGDAADPRR